MANLYDFILIVLLLVYYLRPSSFISIAPSPRSEWGEAVLPSYILHLHHLELRSSLLTLGSVNKFPLLSLNRNLFPILNIEALLPELRVES